MKPESIGIHTVVEVKMTSFGAHVLAAYLDTETARATGQPTPKLEGQSFPRRNVEMPVWELIKVFGSQMVSSTMPMFEEICFAREESAIEMRAGEAERLRSQAHHDLRRLADALGIPVYTHDQLSVSVHAFCNDAPPRVPNSAGYWWHGEDVVKVEDGERLTARINGRRRPVTDEQPWRGPAVVDTRVFGSEDIPF
jgi:hypothetical protein